MAPPAADRSEYELERDRRVAENKRKMEVRVFGRLRRPAATGLFTDLCCCAAERRRAKLSGCQDRMRAC